MLRPPVNKQRCTVCGSKGLMSESQCTVSAFHLPVGQQRCIAKVPHLLISEKCCVVSEEQNVLCQCSQTKNLLHCHRASAFQEQQVMYCLGV